MSAADYKAAHAITERALKVVSAFDDAVEAGGSDRQVAYAAMIILMGTFVRTSSTDKMAILQDFAQRVHLGESNREAARTMQ